MTAQDKLASPAAGRNRGPILEVLREVLPATGTVLEMASGSGEHAVWFARHLPGLVWLPSDPDPAARASIAAWRSEAKLANLHVPLALDASDDGWPLERADAMVCINMLHISPWHATEGLLAGAGRLLGAGAPLVLYGPFRREGVATAPSNESFDASLRARNPTWGLRDLEAVAATAGTQGLRLDKVIEMPANNLSVTFLRD